VKPASIAVALAVVAAFAALGARSVRESLRGGARPEAARSALRAPCPAGALPDDGVCVPVPASPRPPEREVAQGIPRRPDRDSDYGHYELPVPGDRGPSVEASGALPGADGRAPLSGILIRVATGTAVSALGLEGQEGNARVVYADPLAQGTLVTVHTVRERGRQKEYLVVFGNVARASVLAPNAELAPGTGVGVTAREVLSLDVRLVRAGIDVWTLPPDALTGEYSSISVDPRNVFRPRAL
jgi:hypothetical protein